MVTAAPQDQWRLVDVAEHDTRLGQLAHRRRTLAEHVEAERLGKRLAQLGDELVAARTRVADVTRELAKAEADVELVRQRAIRDKARLDAGQGAPRDLQALQHEIESLAQRQSVLEDAQLAVMERLEAAEGGVRALEAEQERAAAEQAEVLARRDAAIAALDDEVGAVSRARADAVSGLPADLVALYEKIRASSGTGAARLRARRCEGCRIELNAVDLGRLRTAPEDAVLRCEECGRILVRTPDSGL
ncbi:MAG TPA: C4-type zinc ribbon domain-containing protein [Kineosporiaceae bacterium]